MTQIQEPGPNGPAPISVTPSVPLHAPPDNGRLVATMGLLVLAVDEAVKALAHDGHEVEVEALRHVGDWLRRSFGLALDNPEALAAAASAWRSKL